MATKKMPIGLFVEGLKAAAKRKDGYIMGSKGQDPKKWSKNSWWFTQYSGEMKEKALYWRENAERVWDCNGMAEGLYEEYTGVNINTKARYNYSDWCPIKGKGDIPVEYRVPGVAVFIHSSSSGYITHVGYLVEPINPADPAGDWYVVEAHGVMNGVVTTKLSKRGWNRWGIMSKYFDYSEVITIENTDTAILKNGSEGDAVKQLQTSLIRLGYSCGKYGADGDFGDATEEALKEFQSEYNLTTSGMFNKATASALDLALSEIDKVVCKPTKVKIVGGKCYIRSKPNKAGKIVTTAKENSVFAYAGSVTEDGWLSVVYNNQTCWVSGRYGKLM